MKITGLSVALSLAFVSISPASAFDRPVNNARIKDNGDVCPPDKLKIGCFKGGKLKFDGDASDTVVTPDPMPAANVLSRSLFESLQGTTFYVRPFLTDLNCKSDQTANIKAALLAAPARAKIQFPPGCIVLTQTLTNTSQLWEGTGSFGGTTIAYSSPKGVAFKLMGDAATLRGFHIYNSVGAADATGIVQSNVAENPTRQALEDIYIHDFTTNIYVESGHFWSWKRVWSRNFKKYGGLVRNLNYSDNGDWSISDYVAQYDGSTPAANTAGLRAESGGSGKISNSKFLGAQYGVDWSQQDAQINVAPGTGILQFTNNSVENQSVIGLRARGGDTSTFASINIAANEFFDQPTSIEIGNNASNVSIAGNVFPRTDTGISLVRGSASIFVGGNTFLNFGTAGVSISEGASAVVVGENNYGNVLNKWRVVDQRDRSNGSIHNSEIRSVLLPAGAAVTPIYRVDTRALRSARMRLVLEGVTQGVSGGSRIYEVLLSNTGSAVTITPISDVSSPGSLPVLTLAPASDASTSIVISVTGAASAFDGSLSITLEGKAVGLKLLR